MTGKRRRLVISEQEQRQISAGQESREALGKSPWTVRYYRDRLRALAKRKTISGLLVTLKAFFGYLHAPGLSQ